MISHSFGMITLSQAIQNRHVLMPEHWTRPMILTARQQTLAQDTFIRTKAIFRLAQTLQPTRFWESMRSWSPLAICLKKAAVKLWNGNGHSGMAPHQRKRIRL